MLELGIDTTKKYLFNRTMPDVVEESLAGLIAETADGCEATLIDHEVELDRIVREVMPDSHAEAGQKARDASAERLQRTQPSIDKLNTAIGMSEGETLAPQVRQRIPDNANTTDWHRAEAEARTIIRGMNDLDRKFAYLDACRSGDTQTIRAYELSPNIERLVDAETIAEGADLWAEAHTPAEWNLLQQQRATLWTIQADLTRAKRELGMIADPLVAA